MVETSTIFTMFHRKKGVELPIYAAPATGLQSLSPFLGASPRSHFIDLYSKSHGQKSLGFMVKVCQRHSRSPFSWSTKAPHPQLRMKLPYYEKVHNSPAMPSPPMWYIGCKSDHIPTLHPRSLYIPRSIATISPFYVWWLNSQWFPSDWLGQSRPGALLKFLLDIDIPIPYTP